MNYATGGACPPITSNWSTGYVPPGFGDYFSSPTTFASGGDTQVIFVSPATPPGSYTLEACLSNAYTGGSNDCVSFVVNVTSSVPPQLTTVMPGFSIKLEDAIPFTPGSHPMPIPTQGHLYLQIYINGAPTSALQAGPSVGDPTPKLVIQPYNQFPLSDPSFDVTAYVTQSCLYAGYNTYLFDQNFEPNHAVVPNYNVGLLNSNSWTDGLLLSCGVQQTTINTWVSDYFAATGRNPTAYQNGNQLLPYFTAVRRHPTIPVGR